MASRTAVVKWLLDGDPSIRWQVMRDLTDEPDEAVAAERSRVASEGWGAELLAPSDTRRPLGRRPAARLDDHQRRPGAAEGSGCGSGGRGSPQSDRPRARPHHLVAARRPALLRRRDRGLHQRQDPGGGRLFRRGVRPAASTACSASSSRTAAGTARRRPARDPRSTPRSACWKGCWNTRRRGAPRPR